MRLESLLHLAGFGSRGTVKKLLASKQVRVDGQIEQRAQRNVDTGIHTITVSNQPVQYTAHRYYLLYKPSGVVSAVRDAQHPCVVDLLAKKGIDTDGVYPIGRLDRNSEGLVLLSDNGPLGYRMLHPQHHVTKQYEVRVLGCLTATDVAQFAQGIRFPDGTECLPAQLHVLHVAERASWARVTIAEGKFHQVKKMFLCVGKKVVFLKRVSFGPLNLPSDLAIGQVRSLTTEELQLLRPFMEE